jgi:hypothetical protein
MKSIPTALADRIESGAATLAHVWLLTRADGNRLGFTDHDEDLLHDGVTCRAASGWTAGASDLRSGFAPGGASVSGALDSEALAAADLDAGLYDGCAVVCRRVDWRESTLAVLLWAGVITRVKREGDAFLAEIDGPLAALDRTAGRSFGRLCDANLGDDRCAVAAGHPAFAEGCDKRWRTCSDRFGNTMNFRGFPTIPGEDFLAVYPARGDRHDGKSRRG